MHGKRQTLDVFTDVLIKTRKIAAKCDLTVFLGDINDTKSNISSHVQRVLIEQLQQWPHEVIVLIGNHDYDNAIECQGHSLEVLNLVETESGYPISVISQPGLYKGMQFVPYLPEERFLQAKLHDAKIAFLHNDIQKAMYSNQAPVESRIDPVLLAHYKRVFVGHIHLPQEYDNIIFVGTPYTESYKESDERKRVIVYDTETDKVLNVPLGVRQHVTFDYSVNSMDDIKTIKADITARAKPNMLIRVRITAPEEIEHKIKRKLFKGLPIDQLKTIKVKNLTKKIQVTDNMSNMDVMNLYLQQVELNDKVRENVNKWNSEILGEIT